MTTYKWIRWFKYIVFCVPVLLSIGCGIGNLENALSDKRDYHFRKTRWGYSKAMVMLSEQKQGTHLVYRKGNTLIYNERISDTPVKLVYCFVNDKLRVAGYLTNKPTKLTKAFFNHVAETLGEPIDMMPNGMVFADYHTLMYIDAYETHVTQTRSQYQFSQGLLKLLDKTPKEEKEEAGKIIRWDGLWTYVDQNFFRQLHEVDYPLDELSFYEKRLFGVLRRQQMQTYITPQGRVTLPINP